MTLHISVDDVGAPEESQQLLRTMGMVPFIILTMYDYIMLFFGTFGNLLILYASVKYNAINLDKVSLVFLSNIAVVDITWTVTTTLTICITNSCGNRWFLGKTLCGLVAYLRHPFAATEILLICLVSCHRIFTIKQALRANSFTPRHAYLLTALSWILPQSVLVVSFLYSVDVKFVPLLSTCVNQIIHDTDPRVKMSVKVLMFLLVIVPFVLTIVTNICMFLYAVKLSRRHATASYRRAFFTVFAICGTFVVTSLPNMIRMLLPPMGKTSPVYLEVVNGHLYLINASCNSIILAITNRRFRMFVMRRVLGRKMGVMGCCCVLEEDEDESLAFHTARSQVNQRVSVTISKCQNTYRTSYRISSKSSSLSNSPVAGSLRSSPGSGRRTKSLKGSPPNSLFRTRSRGAGASVRDSGRSPRSVSPMTSPTLVASRSKLHLVCETKGCKVVDSGLSDQVFLNSFRSRHTSQ
ncbi:hypothetical protein ACHWQZ_G013263 [Mnemiopsis leidyi]